ncbi:hypothetical protein ACH5RR_035345 [Cinchona calisaya]|uniref:Enoyl reductase (ER) domain-containing protein n=1 Tax=Cinchona calisaya TaxID=153742 RepID=A0ABD2YGR7_9GENT
MEQIYAARAGDPKVLRVRRLKKPTFEDDQVLIKVAATTVNKLDLSRRKDGINVFGLECSGEILEIGKLVTRWKLKDKVCALLRDGGGYAGMVAVSMYFVIPAPAGIPLEHAAALPTAGTIIWQSFFIMNRLRKGQRVLIHGANGGVGSLAIQVAKYYGCEVFITAGSQEKLEFCKNLGADTCIDDSRDDFEDHLVKVLNGEGVDFILDCSGEKYVGLNLNIVAYGGRLVIIGFQDQEHATVDLDTSILANKKAEVMGVNVRTSTVGDIRLLMKKLEEYLWPAIDGLQIKPQICASFKFSEAAMAHTRMEDNNNLGKILLIPDEANLS